MPINDFEKQVQQKMDELQLRPSPEVWTEVEKHIRKEKRRRRIILFWWLFPLLLLGGGGAYLIFKPGNTPTITANSQDNSILKQPSSNNTVTQEKNTDETLTGSNNPRNTVDNNPPTSVQRPETENLATKSEIDQSQKYSTTKSFTNRQPLSVPNVSFDEKLIVTAKTDNKTIIPQNQDNDKTVVGIPQASTLKIVADPVESKPDLKTTPALIPVAQDSLKKDTALIVATDKIVIPVIDSVTKPEELVKLQKKSGWNFGLLVQTALSDTRQGELFTKGTANVYSAPSQGAGTAYGPLAPPVLIESPEQDLSFGVKLYGQKKLGRKLNLEAGIGYSYLSTKVKVGEEVTGTRQVVNDMSSSILINSFYRATATTNFREYHNRYHMLGVSGTISWQLINNPKFSLSWDNGLSVERLISTNALLFDGQLRGYYNDFSAFRKTHFFLSSGPTAEIIKGKKLNLALNPFASYGFNSVLKKSDMNSHFIRYGIGLKFLFHSLK